MKKLFSILIISLFIFSCNKEKDYIFPSNLNVPDSSETCDIVYNDIDGSVVSCDNKDCIYSNNECFHLYDLKVLSEIVDNDLNVEHEDQWIYRFNKKEPEILIDHRKQKWKNSRLIGLDLSNQGLKYLPESICSLQIVNNKWKGKDSQALWYKLVGINVANNSLCDEFYYECISFKSEQNISECPGYNEYGKYNLDINFLIDLRNSNESLADIPLLKIGLQRWVGGKLTNLNLYNLEIDSIPNSIESLKYFEELRGIKDSVLYNKFKKKDYQFFISKNL